LEEGEGIRAVSSHGRFWSSEDPGKGRREEAETTMEKGNSLGDTTSVVFPVTDTGG
jgi:hypothetical protein